MIQETAFAPFRKLRLRNSEACDLGRHTIQEIETTRRRKPIQKAARFGKPLDSGNHAIREGARYPFVNF